MLLKRGKVWHCRFMFDGKLFQKSLKTPDKNLARKHEALIRAELLKGEFGILDAKKTPNLAQFETRILEHWKANVAPRTYGFYKQNLKVLMGFGFLAATRLHKIDSALIERFIQARLQDKVATVTINHSLRTLRRVLYIAKEWRILREVPTIKMLPNENQRDYVLDDDTVNTMVDWSRERYPKSTFHLLLPFLVDTGLRITEACNLKKEHIEFKDLLPCAIKITKGKSKFAVREIPLTERASLTLAAALDYSMLESEWAFTNDRMSQITRHYPSEQFRTVRDALKIGPECVLHSTRHTFCSRLGNAGADAFTIQRLAGHSSITISQRYVHTDMEAKLSAIHLLDVLNRPSEKAHA